MFLNPKPDVQASDVPEAVAVVEFAIDEEPLHQMNMFLTCSASTAQIAAFRFAVCIQLFMEPVRGRKWEWAERRERVVRIMNGSRFK